MGEILEKRVFIICPVRGISQEENNFLKNYIKNLEETGYKLHYPPRDTNQNDTIGLNICSENKTAIKKSNEVYMYFNPTSTGTIFDIGMTFMAEKPLFIINNDGFKNDKDKFEHFILKYASNIRIYHSSEFYRDMLKRKEDIKKSKLIEYEWKGNTKDFLFDFGMTFMAEKPIIVTNRDKIQRTTHKSFENVLLELDEFYKK